MNDIKGFFEEHGYYLAKGIFSPAEVKALENDFDRIVAQLVASEEELNARWSGPEMERIGAQTQIIHTHNVQQYSGVWMRTFFQARFIETAAALLGPDVILHHSKLFQKPPEKGAPFPMHQDWTYFPTIKDSMLAGIVHVSDATDEMGCLRVYPGSHKLGRVEGTSGQQQSDMLEKYPLENATVIECEPGDVVFFHYFTLHGSKPNTSSRTRKTVLVQLYAGDDRVEDGVGHTDERLVLQGWNYHAKRSLANQK